MNLSLLRMLDNKNNNHLDLLPENVCIFTICFVFCHLHGINVTRLHLVLCKYVLCIMSISLCFYRYINMQFYYIDFFRREYLLFIVAVVHFNNMHLPFISGIISHFVN